MSLQKFYVESLSACQPNEFATPEALLATQLGTMLQEVDEYGCSKARLAPINGALYTTYKEFGEKPTFDDVIDYDPLAVIEDAVLAVTGAKRATRYDRTFVPGESEGTHSDNHDIVVTYTLKGRANFTIAAPRPRNSHSLGQHNLIAFQGRRLHEVSAPHAKGYRAITAFAVDL